MTGIGDIFEREIKSGGKTISVASLVSVFAQLGPGPFSWPARELFSRAHLSQEYMTGNERQARCSLDRAIKHHAKGWINDKELAFVECQCRDTMLMAAMAKDAKITALRAEEAELLGQNSHPNPNHPHE